MTNSKPLTPPVRKSYRTPAGQFIPRTKETAELYRLDQRRNEAIMIAAVELGKVLKLEDRWREVMPEALLDILENYDRRAAYMAAKAFCDRHPELSAELEQPETRRSPDAAVWFAYIPVRVPFALASYGIGQVQENRSEYLPMVQYGTYDDYAEAAAVARRLNQDAGISEDDARRIIGSRAAALDPPRKGRP